MFTSSQFRHTKDADDEGSVAQRLAPELESPLDFWFLISKANQRASS